jgi:hypothetical protein
LFHNIGRLLIKGIWEKYMLRIAGETKVKPEAVIPLAIKVFVKQHGLTLKTQSPDSAEFEGGGGGLSIRAWLEGKKTEVEIVTMEWENPVKEFMLLLQKK